MLKLLHTIVTVLLFYYGFVATLKVSDYSDLADTYYEQLCLNEYFVSKANPSDPVVLEMQRIAKKNKICDGFDVSNY